MTNELFDLNNTFKRATMEKTAMLRDDNEAPEVAGSGSLFAGETVTGVDAANQSQVSNSVSLTIHPFHTY